MRRFLVVLGVGVIGLLAASSCGQDTGGLFGENKADGAAGTGGKGGSDGGACSPGSKVCPNAAGDLVCIGSNDPKSGCKGSSCVACSFPFATAKCSSDGQCAIDTCDAGSADCNGDPVDGCESKLETDSKNCGACGTDCSASGPGWICTAGKCELNQCCPTGEPSCVALRDCNNDKSDGCETDTSSDANNCSACGTVCSLPNADTGCTAGKCVVIQCKPDWANCDGNDANGCETDTSSDAGNCGACAKVCNSTNGVGACNDGSCEIACSSGYGDCDGDAASNGCETNLKSDPLNCNSCKNKCNPQNVAAASCTDGNCGYTACSPQFGDCDGNKANGCEINISQDKNHCGNCATKCTAPSGGSVVCNNGSCSQNCGSLTNCGGLCVDTTKDVNNCGGCGTICSAPADATPTCNGTCSFQCNTGFAQCSQPQCFDIQNDPEHCGSGCVDCPSPTAGTGTTTCGNGTCGFVCTGSTPNKCGTGCYDSQTDPTHCGPGCKVCPGPTSGTGAATCVGGACNVSCSGTTPTKCGTDCVNTQTDKQHCGDCNPCHASASGCSGGVCTCGSGNYCSDSVGCKACCTPLTQDTCGNFNTCCSDFTCKDCCTPGGQGSAGNSCSSSNTCCSDYQCHGFCT